MSDDRSEKILDAAGVPPAEASAPWLTDGLRERDEAFWGYRPDLASIQEWARARRASPHAVLAVVLAEVICRVPPAVQLPPLIGGRGTLNMLVAVTAASGEGKDSAINAARDAMAWPAAVLPPALLPLGSGEGMAKSYGVSTRNKETKDYELVRYRYTALFACREIASFYAQSARAGATVAPQVRQLYSGQELGFAYSDAEKRAIIPAHSYRGCLLAGVQPRLAGRLLGDADGGTPQRFFWVPGLDPAIADEKPAEPAGRVDWEIPDDIACKAWDDEVPFELPVCEEARQAIDRAAVARNRGQADALDGHSLYTREKIAAGLALLDGRAGVARDDWVLAGHLMRVSDAVRAMATAEVAGVAARQNTARWESEARGAAIISSRAESESTRKAAARILKVLRGTDDWTMGSELRRAVRLELRGFFEEAIEALLDGKQVEARAITREQGGHGGGAGTEYRATP